MDFHGIPWSIFQETKLSMEFPGIPWKKSTRTSFIEGDPESV